MVRRRHQRAERVLLRIVLMRQIERFQGSQTQRQTRGFAKRLLIVAIDLRLFQLRDHQSATFGGIVRRVHKGKFMGRFISPCNRESQFMLFCYLLSGNDKPNPPRVFDKLLMTLKSVIEPLSTFPKFLQDAALQGKICATQSNFYVIQASPAMPAFNCPISDLALASM